MSRSMSLAGVVRLEYCRRHESETERLWGSERFWDRETHRKAQEVSVEDFVCSDRNFVQIFVELYLLRGTFI